MAPERLPAGLPGQPFHERHLQVAARYHHRGRQQRPHLFPQLFGQVFRPNQLHHMLGIHIHPEIPFHCALAVGFGMQGQPVHLIRHRVHIRRRSPDIHHQQVPALLGQILSGPQNRRRRGHDRPIDRLPDPFHARSLHNVFLKYGLNCRPGRPHNQLVQAWIDIIHHRHRQAPGGQNRNRFLPGSDVAGKHHRHRHTPCGQFGQTAGIV